MSGTPGSISLPVTPCKTAWQTFSNHLSAALPLRKTTQHSHWKTNTNAVIRCVLFWGKANPIFVLRMGYNQAYLNSCEFTQKLEADELQYAIYLTKQKEIN